MDHIVVETIHSAFCIHRDHDAIVRYSPPTRLRRYELFILEGASQINDAIAQRLFMAFQELPQRPYMCVAPAFTQLAPVSGGGLMKKICSTKRTSARYIARGILSSCRSSPSAGWISRRSRLC